MFFFYFIYFLFLKGCNSSTVTTVASNVTTSSTLATTTATTTTTSSTASSSNTGNCVGKCQGTYPYGCNSGFTYGYCNSGGGCSYSTYFQNNSDWCCFKVGYLIQISIIL